MSRRNRISQGAIHLILVLTGIVSIYPIFWTLVSSFKMESEIFASSFSLPKVFRVENYVTAWNAGGLQRSFLNSIYVAFFTVVLVIVVSLLASYIIYREKNRVTRMVYAIFLTALMIPPDVMLISMYLQLRSYRLINNFWGIILPSVAMGIPQSVFILANFMKSIPQSLIDSATIDGCSRFGVLWRIIAPLTKAAIGSVAVFQFTGIWNSFMLPLVVLRKEPLMLLPQKLNRFIGDRQIQYSQLFAGIIITFIPVLIFFVCFQRTFLQGTTMGAVKE